MGESGSPGRGRVPCPRAAPVRGSAERPFRPCGTVLTCPGLRHRRPRPVPAPARLPPGAARSRGNSQSSLLGRAWAGSRASQVAGSLSLSHLRLSERRAHPALPGHHAVPQLALPSGHRHVSPRCVTAVCPLRTRQSARLLLPCRGQGRQPRVRRSLTGSFGDGRSRPELIKTLLFVSGQAEENEQERIGKVAHEVVSLFGDCRGRGAQPRAERGLAGRYTTVGKLLSAAECPWKPALCGATITSPLVCVENFHVGNIF